MKLQEFVDGMLSPSREIELIFRNTETVTGPGTRLVGCFGELELVGWDCVCGQMQLQVKA